MDSPGPGGPERYGWRNLSGMSVVKEPRRTRRAARRPLRLVTGLALLALVASAEPAVAAPATHLGPAPVAHTLSGAAAVAAGRATAILAFDPLAVARHDAAPRDPAPRAAALVTRPAVAVPATRSVTVGVRHAGAIRPSVVEGASAEARLRPVTPAAAPVAAAPPVSGPRAPPGRTV